MEGIITLVIIGFVLTFSSQLLKGIGNIFAASGRVGGWILGVILVLFLLKSFMFSSTPTEGSITHFSQTLQIDGSDVEKDGEVYIWNVEGESFEYVYVNGKYIIQ